MYDELIELMRYCANDNPVCEKSESCPFYNQAEDDYGYYFCVERMLTKAADAIESTSKAYQMMAEAYESEVTKHYWIPVTERLPEHSGDYLVYSVGGNWEQLSTIEIAFWNDKNFIVQSFFAVTHWMPLPQPPEREELNG